MLKVDKDLLSFDKTRSVVYLPTFDSLTALNNYLKAAIPSLGCRHGKLHTLGQRQRVLARI